MLREPSNRASTFPDQAAWRSTARPARTSCAAAASALAERVFEVFERDRLDEIFFDSDLCGAGAVLVLAERGEGDDPCQPQRFISLYPIADFKAVDSRQAQIEQNDVGAKVLDHRKREVAVDGVLEGMSQIGQKERQAVRGVDVVFDDQDALGGCGLPQVARDDDRVVPLRSALGALAGQREAARENGDSLFRIYLWLHFHAA